jgi:predicted RNA-binding protein
MTTSDNENQTCREQIIRRIRRVIRAAQLRVVLDQTRGRQTPEAVVRLAQLTMPPMPSPLDALRSPDGKFRTDPASRREVARYVRRTIRAAQLRVVLDEQQGRPTPEAVKRLAQRNLPTLM